MICLMDDEIVVRTLHLFLDSEYDIPSSIWTRHFDTYHPLMLTMQLYFIYRNVSVLLVKFNHEPSYCLCNGLVGPLALTFLVA